MVGLVVITYLASSDMVTIIQIKTDNAGWHCCDLRVEGRWERFGAPAAQRPNKDGGVGGSAHFVLRIPILIGMLV
jgi:hypothetical protein